MFYYVHQIPNDLNNIYSVKRLCFSLKTKSYSTAIRFAKSVSQRLDDYWFGIRLKNMDVPAVDKVRLDNAINDDTPKISEALELYLKLKGFGKDKTFIRTANRNVKYVIKVLGNKSLKSYSSSDGAKFRDWLLANNMNINTVKRVFSSIRSIINITISELGLDCSNGFARTYFPKDDSIESRKPLPIDKIKLIQNLCKEKDDETEVTSKASVNTTEPISLKTSIEPTYVLPLLSSEGNKVKVLLPDSLTVTSKSVPLTETEAVGVVILIFSLLFLAINPEVYLKVPNEAFKFTLPFFVLLSYTNSSIINVEYFDIVTLVSSKNIIFTLPSKVSISSYISTGVVLPVKYF